MVRSRLSMSFLGAVAFLSFASAPLRVRAQSSGEAVAEALFQEGRRLMGSGDYVEACTKLEQSFDIDRAIGTAWNLARCYEEVGRLASAWTRFREVGSLAREREDSVRERIALERARSLEGRLSSLRIDVPPLHRVGGLVVTLDGEVLTDAMWGSEIPVDPGLYRVESTASGYLPWIRRILVRRDEPERFRIEVPEPEPETREEIERVVRRAAELEQATQGPAPDPNAWYRRPWGWVASAGGLLAGAAGVALLIHAGNLAADADRLVDLQIRDSTLSEVDTFRGVGIGLFGIAVAAVAAAVLLFTLPDDEGDETETERGSELAYNEGD